MSTVQFTLLALEVFRAAGAYLYHASMFFYIFAVPVAIVSAIVLEGELFS